MAKAQFYIKELEEGVGSSVVEASCSDSADFPLSSQNSGFHNNPVLKPTYGSLHTPLLRASAAFTGLCAAASFLSFLQTVVATSLVSLFD